MSPQQRPDQRSNVVLIGMPGSGKSTVGVVLAKRLGLGFIDTDLLIQTRFERTLQAIVDAEGYAALRRCEAEVLVELAVERQVVATGGSAVYSPEGMARLQAAGTIVLLDAPLAILEQRVVDVSGRGLAKRPDQSFADLYAERTPLYRRYAERTVDASGPTAEAVCARIEAALTK